MYNEGISLSGDLLDVGIEKGVIKKSGNTYTYSEEKLGIGRETAKTYLKENPKLMAVIRKEILDAVKKTREAEYPTAKPAGVEKDEMPEDEE